MNSGTTSHHMRRNKGLLYYNSHPFDSIHMERFDSGSIFTSPHIKSTIEVEKHGKYPGLVSRKTRVGFPSSLVLVHRPCDSLRADRSLIETGMGTVVSVSRGSGRPIWAKSFTDNHSRRNQGREGDLLALPRAMIQLECYTIWSSSSGPAGTARWQNGGKMAAPRQGSAGIEGRY